MSFATIAGFDVIDFKLALPLNGVWNAQLSALAPALPDGPIQFVIGDGLQVEQLELTGHVLSQGTPFDQTLVARICGGQGDVKATATPRHYAGPPAPPATVRQVLNDLMVDAGEQLSESIDQAFLTSNLNYWTISKHPVAWSMRLLLDYTLGPDANWRVMPDGTFWLGLETWPLAPSNAVIGITQPMPHINRDEVEHESGPLLMPGQVWQGGMINRVQIDMMDAKLRSTVLYV